MTMIFPGFYKTPILNRIDDHINDGCLSYSALEDSDKEDLIAECMNHFTEKDIWDCISNNCNSSDAIRHYIKFFKTADMDNAYEFLREINKNTVEFFSDVLDKLFIERTEEINQEKMWECGMIATSDKINGETIWRRPTC